MKPVEYWVCAIKAGEPECWDGPHRTVEAAFAARTKSFNTLDFAVYEVTARRVAGLSSKQPKAERPQPKAKRPQTTTSARPKVRTQSVRPKAERTPRSKGRR